MPPRTDSQIERAHPIYLGMQVVVFIFSMMHFLILYVVCIMAMSNYMCWQGAIVKKIVIFDVAIHW